MNNQSIKELQLLKKSKNRKIKGKFIAEGKRLVGDAMEYNNLIEEIYCTEKFHSKNKNWWSNFRKSNSLMINIITDTQFKRISSTSTPSGIAALCKINRSPSVSFKENRWIYLDEIRDPGNLGTILRSALWFGIKNIILSSGSVDPYNPKVIRSGMGSHFGLNLYQNVELVKFVKTHSIIAGAISGESVYSLDIPEKYVLVLGSEAHGISKNIERFIQKRVSIKKIGEGDSLNLSSAASILMYVLTSRK